MFINLSNQVFKSFVATTTLTLLSLSSVGSAFAGGVTPIITDTNYDFEDIDTSDNSGGTKWVNHLISGGVGFLSGYIVGSEVQKGKNQRDYDKYVNQHPVQQDVQHNLQQIPKYIKIVPAPAGEPNCGKIVTLKSGQIFCELTH